MYLREMGAVELLSREGEIAIAKRIEAGRDMMIMGLCQSPITFHAIIQWSEALNNEEMQLREILDLDAMLSKEPPAGQDGNDDAEDDDDDGEISEETAGPSIRDDDDDDSDEEDSDGEDGEEGSSKSDEEEEEDNTMSLAQMEAALKPDAIERFARIKDLFGKFEKLQEGTRRNPRSRRRISRQRRKRNTRHSQTSSPPRWKASSSTRRRSSSSSTTFMPSIAA